MRVIVAEQVYLRQTTETNRGEEVDGESSVLGIVARKDAFEVFGQRAERAKPSANEDVGSDDLRIGETVVQFSEAKEFCEF